jgi:pyruvate dehydrogenase E1 component alpha subunit
MAEDTQDIPTSEAEAAAASPGDAASDDAPAHEATQALGDGAPAAAPADEDAAAETPAAETPDAERPPWTLQPIDVPDGGVEETVRFATYAADTVTHEDLDLTEDDLLDMYHNMLLQRRFEERCRQMYQRQKISGFLHLYIGQEAVSTGAVNAIRLGEDTVITAYRDHGIGLAMGMDPNACMAELFGKRDGTSKGKGGSMHFFDKGLRMFGGHGIVGAQVPVGVGIAFANKYKGEDTVCLTYLGDGAINQGAFHEACNLASLYDLPVVIICENNQYGMGTAVDRATAEPELYKQAYSYDMPGALVYGMDVFAVTKAMRDHVAMARAGQPSFVEIRTYRYQGHSISDPATYRQDGELDDRKSMDPIVRLQRYLTDHDVATNDQLDAMDEEIKQQVLDAIDFADTSPLPDDDALYDDIYAEPEAQERMPFFE